MTLSRCVCGGEGVSSGCVLYYHDISKTPDGKDLKFVTVVVLDTASKSIDLGFKRTRVRGTESSFQHGDFGTPQYLRNG